MNFNQFLRELNGERAEGELIKTFLYSIITSFLVLGILYFIKLRFIENFSQEYGLFLFLAILSYALVIPSIRHVNSYKEITCMAGMMVGMTTGMIAGFLAGFYVASTNGMFVGSIFGMTVGIVLGIWNGKCCGVMGVMEGSMAGFMGGLMGAMTAFMLLNDHLRATAIVVFIICSAILIGLHYMIYKEMRESSAERKKDHFITIALSFVLTIITTWIIVYGPRSSIFG